MVIVGQGNVALDCARLLAKPLASLEGTDLTAASLAQLAASRVTDIHIIGRRGHVQAAFTIKELRELTRLPGVRVEVLPSELAQGSTESSLEEVRTKRPLKRLTDLIAATAAAATSASEEQQQEEEEEEQQQEKIVHIRFLLTPVQVREGPGGRVCSVLFEKCRLTGPPHAQTSVPTGAGLMRL